LESLLVTLVFLFVLYFSFKNTAVTLAILLNIVVFRSIPYVDYKAPYYGYYNENDIVLGAILPVLSFVIIIFRVCYKKKSLKFKLDVFDVFMISLTIIMLFSILFSPDYFKSIFYTGIFIFLALPFYFVTKVYLLNSENFTKSLYTLFNATVFFTIIFSIVSLYLHEIARYPYERMTFPGVYPIPFCLFLCLGLILLIIYRIKPTYREGVKKNLKYFYSIPVIFLILFSIIKTNTRGPVVALILASITLLFIFFKIKLNVKIITGFIVSVFLGLVAFFSFFDVNKVAVRFIELMPKDAESITPRLLAYFDSIKILFTRPFGISVGTFGIYYSDQDSISDSGTYAHNLFMEFISSFGIFGVLLTLGLIYILLFEYNFLIKNQKKVFQDPLFFTSIALMFFFFFETQFSFTLNTHKGFYLSLAFYSVLKFKFLKNNILNE